MKVVGVSCDGKHNFSKRARQSIRLIAGLGVGGDAHLGATVQHLSRLKRDPTAPNLRQVHLIQAELHDELAKAGFALAPGQMGENITTRGIDLMALPTGTRLHIGDIAVVEVTGLRNPCGQLDTIQPGLMAATRQRGLDGKLIRKAGIMGIVITGGGVRSGDAIRVILPPLPHTPLERV